MFDKFAENCFGRTCIRQRRYTPANVTPVKVGRGRVHQRSDECEHSLTLPCKFLGVSRAVDHANRRVHEGPDILSLGVPKRDVGLFLQNGAQSQSRDQKAGQTWNSRAASCRVVGLLGSGNDGGHVCSSNGGRRVLTLAKGFAFPTHRESDGRPWPPAATLTSRARGPRADGPPSLAATWPSARPKHFV